MGDEVREQTFTEEELEEILRKHMLWLDSDGNVGTRADLRDATLINVSLQGANLVRADLAGVDLRSSYLQKADLQAADLSRANLREANLQSANLRGANLREADLRDAKLHFVMFYRSDLQATILANAVLGHTTLSNVDLSDTVGLDQVQHSFPSTVGMDTLTRSRGRIPDVFLKGCGLSDVDIACAKLHDPDLTQDQITDIGYRIIELRGRDPIQISPVFISYQHNDRDFVVALHDRLDGQGIRVWRDEHKLTAGPMEKQLERGMRLHPTVILVLSQHSVESDWVEWEATKARELEKKLGKPVLCPVALDDAWHKCDWPGPLRNQIKKYFVLPFDDWGDSTAFDRQFEKLVDGIGIFYRRPSADGEPTENRTQ